MRLHVPFFKVVAIAVISLTFHYVPTALCITAIKWTTHVTLERPLYRRTYRPSLRCSATLRITWTSIYWRYAFLLRSNKVYKSECGQCCGLMISKLGSEARGLGSSPVGLIVLWYAVTRHLILTMVMRLFTKDYWYGITFFSNYRSQQGWCRF